MTQPSGEDLPKGEDLPVPATGAIQGQDPREMVEQPAKLLRIGSMVREMLVELRSAELDEEGRKLMREIHERGVRELKEILAPDLIHELDEIRVPLESAIPTESELRLSQAQLMGWLEGLFHGIQAALVTQQMQMQQQLSELGKRTGQEQPRRTPGQYL